MRGLDMVHVAPCMLMLTPMPAQHAAKCNTLNAYRNVHERPEHGPSGRCQEQGLHMCHKGWSARSLPQ